MDRSISSEKHRKYERDGIKEQTSTTIETNDKNKKDKYPSTATTKKNTTHQNLLQRYQTTNQKPTKKLQRHKTQ